MTESRNDGMTDRLKTVYPPKTSFCGGGVLKVKPSSFKSRDNINEKGDGPYRGFGYLSLINDPKHLATSSQRQFLQFFKFY